MKLEIPMLVTNLDAHRYPREPFELRIKMSAACGKGMADVSVFPTTLPEYVDISKCKATLIIECPELTKDEHRAEILKLVERELAKRGL